MAYKLLPATIADIPDIVTVYDAAFKDDPFVGQIMPKVNPAAKREYDEAYYTNEFEMGLLNGLRFFKAVDGDG